MLHFSIIIKLPPNKLDIREVVRYFEDTMQTFEDVADSHPEN